MMTSRLPFLIRLRLLRIFRQEWVRAVTLHKGYIAQYNSEDKAYAPWLRCRYRDHWMHRNSWNTPEALCHNTQAEEVDCQTK